MSEDQLKGPFETALEAACAELSNTNQEVEQIQNHLNETKQRANDIKHLINELIRHVPESQWPLNLADLLGLGQAIQLQLDIGSEAYTEMLKIIFSMPEVLWTAEEVESELLSRGCKVQRKFISNTFSRLAAKGAMRKLSRGQYAVDESRDIEITDFAVVIKPKQNLAMTH